MKCLHIKKIEEYNPGYQDRSLIWCKAYFKMNNADPEFEMLCEIDKWRFIAFVMLELQIKKPVLLDEKYLVRKGFDFKTRKLNETLDSLSQSIDIIDVTYNIEERNAGVTQSRVEESRVYEEEKSRVYVDFEKSTLATWNSFCDKFPILSKVNEISGKRRDKLKKRFEVESFRNFESIILALESQKFLFGENDRKWRVSFDWIIENDTNYLKILEKKYLNHETESDLVKVKEKYKL